MSDMTGDILIVDDVSANLQILREMLVKDHYMVRAAINGETALIALQQQRPDIILLDIMMAEMDGYEVCRRVKSNPQTADIPVIFITALSDPIDKVMGFELGAVDYITKPFNMSEVRARVKTHFSLHKQQQENIRLNRLYDDLFNNVNDLIQSVDKDGNFQYVNRCWCETLGYTADEAQGMNLRQMVHPDYVAHCLEVLERLGHNHLKDVSLFAIFLTKAGQEVLVEGHITASYTEQKLLHTRGIFRNVTEKKRLEEQELQLTIEREKMRALNYFISTVSHDLRTPLTRIGLSAHIMTITSDPEKIQRRAETIIEQVASLNTMLSKMLHLTLLESGTSLKKDRYNLNTLINVSEKYQTLAQTKQIQVQYQLAASLPDLTFDYDFIQDAYYALLHNALLYTPEGGAVTVRTVVQDGHIVLSVADTGVGIPAANLPLIFDRFYKVNTARTANGSGAGLGLALVKKIAEAHEGQVIVTSEEGQGSTFFLLLPLYAAEG